MDEILFLYGSIINITFIVSFQNHYKTFYVGLGSGYKLVFFLIFFIFLCTICDFYTTFYLNFILNNLNINFFFK